MNAVGTHQDRSNPVVTMQDAPIRDAEPGNTQSRWLRLKDRVARAQWTPTTGSPGVLVSIGVVATFIAAIVLLFSIPNAAERHQKAAQAAARAASDKYMVEVAYLDHATADSALFTIRGEIATCHWGHLDDPDFYMWCGAEGQKRFPSAL